MDKGNSIDRLWSVEDVWVLAASGGESAQPTTKEALRLL